MSFPLIFALAALLTIPGIVCGSLFCTALGGFFVGCAVMDWIHWEEAA
jgi:hypothetical protein